MPSNQSLSLTDVVDLFMLQGPSKVTKVRALKNRQAYSPATDFYGPLRKQIISIHQNCQPKSSLTRIVASIADPKKIGHYSQAVQGYAKWWGNKSIGWFQPPRANHVAHGFDVRVNPELGLIIGGSSFVVKLYFKDKAMDKHRANLALAMLEHHLRPQVAAGTQIAILDVPRGKLILPGKALVQINVVDAELAYLAALWPHV